MDLTKKILPSTVEVDGKAFKIKTDSQYWFRFAEMLEDKGITFGDFDFLYIDEKPENRKTAFEKLYEFYYEKKELPRIIDKDDKTKTLDYKIDSDLIYSAFLECYGIDLIETPLHWHKTRALISGLHDTKLNDVMGIRCYKGKDKDYNNLKNSWTISENDDYTDEMLEEFNSLFD